MPESLSPKQEQVLKALSKTVAKALADGTSEAEVARTLTEQGWSEEQATKLVAGIARALESYRQSPPGRRALAERHRKRMMRGLLWTVAGIAITVITHSAASSSGTYLIFWGAILFGVIDFLAGLVGWLRNK